MPLAAWFGSRLLLLAAVAAGARRYATGQSVVDALHLWDGNWYLSAAAGYAPPSPALSDLPQTNIAFFPAYPLLARAVGALPGVTLRGGAIALNLVLGAVVAVGLWWLVHRLSGDRAADRAVLLWCFFPGSVVLSMVYAEPLMLVFAVGCLLALLDRRWLLAGSLAALAGATRPNGIALAAACAWAAGAALRHSDRDGRRDWRALVAPALAPLGFAGYLGWLWWRTGAATIWLRTQKEGWGEEVDFGRRNLGEVLLVLQDPGGVPLTVLLQVAGLAVAVAGLAALWRWRPPGSLTAYTLAVLALAMVSQTLGARPRFVLTAFPLVAALAWAARGRLFAALLAAAAALSAVLAVVYTVPLVAVP